jgi:exodeoxyribonuclease-3
LQNVPGYHSYWHEAEKKGYSGVGIYSKTEPLAVRVGLGDPRFDSEGRVLTLEYADFHLVNAYFPNSQHGLVRLDYKLAFNTAFLAYCETLRKTKPVVFCGDLNVAHEEIDLANPKQNTMNPGFCIEERNWFSGMLARGYADTFRLFSKEGGQYSWWSYRFKAREKNIGWRIDYFVVSRELLPRVTRAWILDQVYGSDHCPVALELS